MNKILTRRNITGLSIFALFSILGILFYDTYPRECAFLNQDGVLVRYCQHVIYSLIPFASLLPLALWSFKLKDEVFTSWVRFALWWIPVSLIGISMFPLETGGWLSLPVKGPVAGGFSGLLIIISSIIIVIKSRKIRNQPKE